MSYWPAQLIHIPIKLGHALLFMLSLGLPIALIALAIFAPYLILPTLIGAGMVGIAHCFLLSLDHLIFSSFLKNKTSAKISFTIAGLIGAAITLPFVLCAGLAALALLGTGLSLPISAALVGALIAVGTYSALAVGIAMTAVSALVLTPVVAIAAVVITALALGTLLFTTGLALSLTIGIAGLAASYCLPASKHIDSYESPSDPSSESSKPSTYTGILSAWGISTTPESAESDTKADEHQGKSWFSRLWHKKPAPVFKSASVAYDDLGSDFDSASRPTIE